MTAGQLRERIIFDCRAAEDDGMGNVEGPFVAQFTVWGEIKAATGREEVLAQRLQGVQPVKITVRRSADTLRIGAGWRARDARTGAVYAITSPAADPDGRRAYLVLTAALGRAA